MIHYRLSYQSLKQRDNSLTQAAYDGHYLSLRATHGTDPDLIFTDATKTIEIQNLYGEDLVLFKPGLVRDLKNLSLVGTGGSAQILDQLFLSEEGQRRKDDFLAASRDQLRTQPYLDVPESTPDIDPALSAAENIRAMATSGAGISFGGKHGHAPRNAAMMALLDAPQGLGDLRLFFIEELGVGDQPLIDDYLRSQPGTALPERLATRVRSIQGMAELLQRIQRYNLDHPAAPVSVYAINSAEAKMRQGRTGPETRVAMMNAVAKGVMDDAIRAHPDLKFLAFVGAAHSNTHAGGIPGISQLYGVPAVELDEADQLTLSIEEKALRGMPPKDLLERVEKALNAQPQVSAERDFKLFQELIDEERASAFLAMSRTGKKAHAEELLRLNVPLNDAELAEVIAIRSEEAALTRASKPDQDAHVNATKHSQLIETLIDKLKALPREVKLNSLPLVEAMVTAVSKDDLNAFFIKPKTLRKNHVSITVNVAQREWLAQLTVLGEASA